MLGMRVSSNLVLVDTCRRLPGMQVLIFLLFVFLYLWFRKARLYTNFKTKSVTKLSRRQV